MGAKIFYLVRERIRLLFLSLILFGLLGLTLVPAQAAGSAALLKDIRPGDLTSDPTRVTAAGGLGFFAANDGINGKELWITDGTDTGTFVVDIRSGGSTSRLGQITAAGDRAFFSAFDGVSGQELWTSDGTIAGP